MPLPIATGTYRIAPSSDGANDNEGSDNAKAGADDEEGNSIVIGLSIDIDDDDGDEEGTEGTLAQSPRRDGVCLTTPEAAWRQNDKERELILLEAAKRIKMKKGAESPLSSEGGDSGSRCSRQ